VTVTDRLASINRHKGQHTMPTLADTINAQLVALDLAPLNAEQIACLSDAAQSADAAAMLADLEARCGVRLPLSEGVPTKPLYIHEDHARDEAAELAPYFDAVCVRMYATDESRITGHGNEYRVHVFSGPDAGVAAAYWQEAGYWVNGEEH
jgi:hypothetical protein